MEFAFDYINTVEIVEPKELLNARGPGGGTLALLMFSLKVHIF